ERGGDALGHLHHDREGAGPLAVGGVEGPATARPLPRDERIEGGRERGHVGGAIRIRGETPRGREEKKAGRATRAERARSVSHPRGWYQAGASTRSGTARGGGRLSYRSATRSARRAARAGSFHRFRHWCGSSRTSYSSPWVPS